MLAKEALNSAPTMHKAPMGLTCPSGKGTPLESKSLHLATCLIMCLSETQGSTPGQQRTCSLFSLGMHSAFMQDRSTPRREVPALSSNKGLLCSWMTASSEGKVLHDSETDVPSLLPINTWDESMCIISREGILREGDSLRARLSAVRVYGPRLHPLSLSEDVLSWRNIVPTLSTIFLD